MRIEEITWHECETCLAEILQNNEATQKAISYLEKRMAQLPITQVPPADRVIGLHKHDQHILSYSKQHRVIVLTTDNNLRMRLLKEKCRVIAPDDSNFWSNPYQLPAHWGHKNAAVDIGEILVLIWAEPQGWAGQQTETVHTLFSAENWGRIVYINDNKRIMRFESVNGQCLDTQIPVKSGEKIVVAVTTHIDLSNLSKAKSCIYARSMHADPNSHHVPQYKVLMLPRVGAKTEGSHQGRDSWNGYIRSIHISGNWLSKQMWRTISSQQDFVPSFCLDNDKLKDGVDDWLYGRLKGLGI